MPDFAQIVREIAILAVPFLLAITCHEVAHGYVAYRLGDPTAKNAGRLTLNPLKHLDPLGTLVLVLTRMIGWAKPVPVDPRYFKDPRQGMMLCSLAGPGANVALAIGFAALFHILAALPAQSADMGSFQILSPLLNICYAGVMLNLVLAIFNLIPIPPLDGSSVLAYFLPPQVADSYLRIGRYGFLIVIVLIMTGVLQRFVLWPVLDIALNILL
jgi:Zn-dependent protease